MTTAFYTILMFGLVIAIHEFGHFFVAKVSGVKVHEFALGMGPRLFHIKRGETEYTLRLLPIGGYVKMEGEDEESDDERSFSRQPGIVKILIVAAGAIMNFVLALVVFIIYSYGLGFPTTVIDLVIDDLPAYEAGIEKGDKIIDINDTKIDKWSDVTEEIMTSDSGEVEVTVLRGEEEKTFKLTPSVDVTDNRKIIGIQPVFEKSLTNAVKGGFTNFWLAIKLMFNFIGNIFKGELNTDEVSGPIGLVYAVSEVSKQGFLILLFFTGLISINLGVFNLLPIPALDGSRIVFLLIELIRGKPVDANKEGLVHMIGFVALMTLMVFVAYNDIMKFGILDKFMSLFN